MLKPGDDVNGITIIEHIASGGMGDVYKGQNTASEEYVALKTIRPGLAKDAKFVGLLKKEAKVLATIRHPAIVQTFGIFEDTTRGFTYLLMEFVDGPSLADLMNDRNQELDPQTLLDVAESISSGLAALVDDVLVCHRDVSPDNIILRDGDPKNAVLIDFGVAADSEQQSSDAFIGKETYAAPEQQSDNFYAEHRSDLYSLGMSLFAAYEGAQPNLGKNRAAILETKRNYEFGADFPSKLGELVLALTQPEPVLRPKDAVRVLEFIRDDRPLHGDYSNDVQNLATKQATEKRATKSAPREVKPTKESREKRPVLWKALVSIPLLLISAFASYFVYQSVTSLPCPVSYRFVASVSANGSIALRGNVPSSSEAERIASKLGDLSGKRIDDFLVPAGCLPSDEWLSAAQSFAELIHAIPGSEVEINGTVVTIRMEASGDTIEKVTERAEEIARAANLTLDLQTQILEPESDDDIRSRDGHPLKIKRELEAVLNRYETCGRLKLADGNAFGSPYDIEGQIPESLDLSALERALKSTAPDYEPDTSRVVPVPDYMCPIYSVLKRESSSLLDFRVEHTFYDSDPNYRAEYQPVWPTNDSRYSVPHDDLLKVTIQQDQSLSDHYLTVFATTQKPAQDDRAITYLIPFLGCFHDKPIKEIVKENPGAPDIRVIYSLQENDLDCGPAWLAEPTLIVAIATDKPLFDYPRPQGNPEPPHVSEEIHILAEDLPSALTRFDGTLRSINWIEITTTR